MGGEPTLHPRFNDIFRNTYKDVLPYSHLSVFSNGLMPDKVLDLMLEMAGPKGARNKNVVFAILLNWQPLENISEKNHARCREVAEAILGKNGYSLMFSLNLYSINQDLATQCWEIDEVYQNLGLPPGQTYKIRVSPAFPIVGEEGHITLPIKDYPKMGRMMIELLKAFPQMCFRFDCSFPPCLMDDINEDEDLEEEEIPIRDLSGFSPEILDTLETNGFETHAQFYSNWYSCYSYFSHIS